MREPFPFSRCSYSSRAAGKKAESVPHVVVRSVYLLSIVLSSVQRAILQRYFRLVLVTGGEPSFQEDDPASAQSRADSIPHPFPSRRAVCLAATQRYSEGEAGSPLQAGREGNIWPCSRPRQILYQGIYHDLREKTSPILSLRTRYGAWAVQK